jgi:cellulose biosynthesis protein BcsQ
MPVEGSYAIWNNHGGTGKTTLTYHLAIKYALKHPDKTIVLIDMCPQADLSHAFLGDDDNGFDYVSQIATLKKEAMCFGDLKIPKTVSGYLDLCTSIGLPKNVDPRTFLINVSKFNSLLPHNLYLLCGDPSIELIARALEIKRSSSVTQYGTNAWKHITTCLKQFVKKIGERKGIKLCTFIDTNPAFSICTEIALCAAERLIIPINDDQVHRNAFEYMFAIVYGFSHPNSVYYYYRHLSLYYRANEYDVQLPKIYLVLNTITSATCDAVAKVKEDKPRLLTADGVLDDCNNSNTHRSTNASWDFIFALYQRHPQAFCTLKQTDALDEFKNLFVINIDTQQTPNNVIKEAVRSHSPLFPAKNLNNCQNGLINNQSTQQSVATNTTPEVSTYPYQHQRHLSNQTRLSNKEASKKQLNDPNTNNLPLKTTISPTSSQVTVNDDDKHTNTMLFDKILDKIVERLTEK